MGWIFEDQARISEGAFRIFSPFKIRPLPTALKASSIEILKFH
jgi:hypothetical protein